jgi:hypothetical protein
MGSIPIDGDDVDLAPRWSGGLKSLRVWFDSRGPHRGVAAIEQWSRDRTVEQ